MSKSTQNQNEGITRGTDLPDSARDQRELKSEKVTLDLPDVKDIPGQEFIHPLNPGEYADTTISSADEEGGDLWVEDEDVAGDSNVSSTEKDLLRTAANDMPTGDDTNLRKAELDNVDDDGDALNENAGVSGSDLDVPGADEDDSDEELGEEDEENNSYSLGGDDQNANEERNGN